MDIRTILSQELNNFRVPVFRSEVERRVSVAICRIDICALLSQEFDGFHVALISSEVDRCESMVVFRMDICTVFDQKLDDFRVPLTQRECQCALAHRVARHTTVAMASNLPDIALVGYPEKFELALRYGEGPLQHEEGSRSSCGGRSPTCR